jgi:Flp pilus assembly protein TadB
MIKRCSSFVVSFVPWIAIGIAYLISPSYMAPFMSDPLGIACLLLMLVWTIAGIAFSAIPESPGC